MNGNHHRGYGPRTPGNRHSRFPHPGGPRPVYNSEQSQKQSEERVSRNLESPLLPSFPQPPQPPQHTPLPIHNSYRRDGAGIMGAAPGPGRPLERQANTPMQMQPPIAQPQANHFGDMTRERSQNWGGRSPASMGSWQQQNRPRAGDNQNNQSIAFDHHDHKKSDKTTFVMDADKLLQMFRSLECKCCQKHFGYQSRVNRDLLYCSVKCIGQEQGSSQIPAPEETVGFFEKPSSVDVTDAPHSVRSAPFGKSSSVGATDAPHSGRSAPFGKSSSVGVTDAPHSGRSAPYASEVTANSSRKEVEDVARNVELARVPKDNSAAARPRQAPIESRKVENTEMEKPKLPQKGSKEYEEDRKVACNPLIESFTPGDRGRAHEKFKLPTSIPTVEVEANPKLLKMSTKLGWSELELHGQQILERTFTTDKDFFVSTIETAATAAALLEKIYELIQKSRAPLKSLEVGTLCLAPFEDAYYRAEIIGIGTEGTADCTVFFLDYGNEAKVLTKDICQMPVELLKTPRCAVYCKWDMAETKELPANKFPSFFKDETLPVIPKVKIAPGQYLVGISTYSPKSQIVVKETGSSGTKDANGPSAKPRKIPTLKPTDANSGNTETEQPQLQAKEDKKVVFQKDPLVLQSPGERSGGRGREKVKLFTSSPPSTPTVTVEVVANPKLLKMSTELGWCDLELHGQQILERTFVTEKDFFVSTAEASEAAATLLDEIYEIVQEPRSPLKNLDVGTLCLAPFEDTYYRAEIIELGKEGSADCTVFFFDYGNEAVVSRKDITTIPIELLTTPRCAVYCKWDMAETNELPPAKIQAILKDETLPVIPKVKIAPGQYLVGISTHSPKAQVRVK